MLDKERILTKIDELDNYLKELNQIAPGNFREYKKIEKKRSCERLLHLSLESVIDICRLFVAGLRLGLPSRENDLFDKMVKKGILSVKMSAMLKEMRGFRNILAHEYAAIDDELVFEVITTKLKDFRKFTAEILKALKKF